MKHTSSFQLVVLIVAGFLIVGGVVAFAILGGSGAGSGAGAVVMWGTLDAGKMQSIIDTLKQSDKSFSQFTYVQKDSATYEADLVDAIASGQPPDLALLPQSDLLAFSDKLQAIPWSDVSQSTFQNSFIDEGQIFLVGNGSAALPFIIDPLVMYWNRDLYASSGIAQAPQYWNDVVADAPLLSKVGRTGALTQSAVNLGGWSNIKNAKAIFSTLLLQAGDPLVSRDASGVPKPVFGTNASQASQNPAEAALILYSDFADPSKTVYSWNSSLPESADDFASGVLATYFGFSSEYPALVARNPNLHIGVSLMPQAHTSTTQTTFGAIEGLAIPRGAKNQTGAVNMAQKLTSVQAITLVSQTFGLPPVRRDMVENTQSDAVTQVFTRSSLISRGWLDPNPQGSDGVFSQMVQSVTSGALVPADAVSAAAGSFAQLFPQKSQGAAR